MAWSITSSVKHGGSSLLKWTCGAANGTTLLLFIDDVTVDGGSKWTGRCTDLNSHSQPKTAKLRRGSSTGRMDKTEWNILKAPDFNLNGRFFFQILTHIQAVQVSSPSFHIFVTAYHVSFIHVKSMYITNVSWLYVDTGTKTRGRSKTDAGSVQSRVWTRAKCKAGYCKAGHWIICCGEGWAGNTCRHNRSRTEHVTWIKTYVWRLHGEQWP